MATRSHGEPRGGAGGGASVPQYELAIHRLVGRNESFRDICAELAEAELALSPVDSVPQASRESRRAEWLDLVQQLSREVEAMLSGTSRFAKERRNPSRLW